MFEFPPLEYFPSFFIRSYVSSQNRTQNLRSDLYVLFEKTLELLTPHSDARV